MTETLHRDTGSMLVRKPVPAPSSRIEGLSPKAAQLAESFASMEEDAKILKTLNDSLTDRLGKVETAFAMSQNDVKHLTARAERAETQLERYRNFANNLLARIKNAEVLLADLAAIRPEDFREDPTESRREAAIHKAALSAIEQELGEPDHDTDTRADQQR